MQKDFAAGKSVFVKQKLMASPFSRVLLPFLFLRLKKECLEFSLDGFTAFRQK